MKAVFADTSYYIGLLNPEDNWHPAAKTLADTCKGTIVTSEYILLELGSLMSRARKRSIFMRHALRLRSDVQTLIVPASSEVFDLAFKLFSERTDKDWSLTDCTSFVIMNHYQITDALTSDHHFDQAVFTRLLNK